MSFTRFHDDPCRIKKQLQESTGPGRYIMNQPGWGSNPEYQEDPHIRLQGWGGNLRSNTINLESDLRGLTRNLNQDCISYTATEVKSNGISSATTKSFTEQTRTTHPAWALRDLETTRPSQILFLDPQKNTSMPFANNISSRNQEKDCFQFDFSHAPN